MATDAQRTHILHVLDYFQAHAAHLLYPPRDVRTWVDNECWHWSEQTLHTMLGAAHFWQGDCSEFGSYVLKCAGLWRWNTAGATSSHLQLLHPVYTDARQAYTGALVVFGGGGGHHEAVVHTPDHKHGNPLLASHGRPGYDLVRLSDLEAEQTRMGYPGVRLLSIAHL